jgi:hypothetical protein
LFFAAPSHEGFACEFAGYIAGVERQSPLASVRRFPAERPLRHAFDETAFLEFGKGALGRSSRNVASLGSPANGQPNLAIVSAIVEPRDFDNILGNRESFSGIKEFHL